jgi:hypothetical protein
LVIFWAKVCLLFVQLSGNNAIVKKQACSAAMQTTSSKHEGFVEAFKKDKIERKRRNL